MDLYQQVAGWAGWPIVFAATILAGGAVIWIMGHRLKLQKEINERLRYDAERNRSANSVIAPKTVKYRAVIKLIHVQTSVTLHSHRRNHEHPGSSGQQQVTAFAGSNEDDYWTVKAAHNYKETFQNGKAVQHGDIIRLEHVTTRKNLHSHSGRPSPVSGQQEVTAFGRDGIGDSNDNWRVDLEGGETWLEGERIRLVHHATDAALHSHEGYSLGDSGYYQQEVTCFGERNQDDWWRAAIHRDASLT